MTHTNEMVKETKSDLNPLFAQKHSHHHVHVFLKLAVSCLLVGLAIRLLFFTDSFSLSSVVHNPPPLAANAIVQLPILSFPSPPPPSPSLHFPPNQTQTSPRGNTNFMSMYCSRIYSSSATHARSAKCVLDPFSTKRHT